MPLVTDFRQRRAIHGSFARRSGYGRQQDREAARSPRGPIIDAWAAGLPRKCCPADGRDCFRSCTRPAAPPASITRLVFLETGQ
jgi:hypothetical protein